MRMNGESCQICQAKFVFRSDCSGVSWERRIVSGRKSAAVSRQSHGTPLQPVARQAGLCRMVAPLAGWETNMEASMPVRAR